MTAVQSSRAQTALAQRLAAAAAVLLPNSAQTDDSADASHQAHDLLTNLVAAVHADPRPDRVWLLFTAIAATFPDSNEVQDMARGFELMDLDEATVWLLNRCLDQAIKSGTPTSEIRIVQGGVIVDVSHSAKSNLHTGIQQVVRSAVPRWLNAYDITPSAWTEACGGMRELTPDEHERALRWRRDLAPVRADDSTQTLLVPWRSVVVLAEVPPRDACQRLAALAEYSGNRLVAIGYDCIPVVTADMLPLEEPSRFVHYLTAIKHSSRVAAISASAQLEFAGFAYALPTQGLAGPQVFECLLPISKLENTGAAAATFDSDLPLVLCVGSHEPRKNHLAVLYAAERLWREGLQFQLLLIGGSGWGTRLADRAAYLEAQGRPISIVRKASIADLVAAYERARFTVFPSLHEGYGLPVAESMAHGTPVITANFGSMGELLRHGGGLPIDTRDDEAIVAAMRSLLTDDALLQRLRSELTRLPKRSWDDYAGELWDNLVRPELATLAGHTELMTAAGRTAMGVTELT